MTAASAYQVHTHLPDTSMETAKFSCLMNHFIIVFVCGFSMGFFLAAIIAVILGVLAVLSLTMDASDLPSIGSKKLSFLNYRRRKYLD